MNDILQYMFQDGFLTGSEVIALRKTCKDLHENQVRILRSLNIARPEEIQSYIQRTYRIPAVTEQLIEALDDSFKALIPIDIAINYGVFAIAEESERLHVAMEDPSDHGLIHKLEFFLNRKITPVAATVYQIAAALQKLYDVGQDQLKLTTLLESSRGVVGGVKPKFALAAPENQEIHTPRGTIDEVLPPDEESSAENLTQRVMAHEVDDLDFQTPTDSSSGIDDPFSAPSAQASDVDPFADPSLGIEASPAADEALPEEDIGAGEVVFFEPSSSPDDAQEGTDTGLLFESNAPPEGSIANPGEVAFLDEPPAIESVAADSALDHDLTPGDVVLFEEAPQDVDPALDHNLTSGDNVLFDEAAQATGSALDQGLTSSETILFEEDSQTTDPASAEEPTSSDADPFEETQQLTVPTQDDEPTPSDDLPLVETLADSLLAESAYETSVTLDLKALSVQANALLVKISLVSNRAAGIMLANEKLAGIGVELALREDGTVEAKTSGVTLTGPTADALGPLIRRIERLSA